MPGPLVKSRHTKPAPFVKSRHTKQAPFVKSRHTKPAPFVKSNDIQKASIIFLMGQCRHTKPVPFVKSRQARVICQKQCHTKQAPTVKCIHIQQVSFVKSRQSHLSNADIQSQGPLVKCTYNVSAICQSQSHLSKAMPYKASVICLSSIVEIVFNMLVLDTTVFLKPQSHIHGFGPGRATVHPDLSNCGASA